MAATIRARLTCDEPTARRLAAFAGESLDPDNTVCAAFEDGDGAWTVELDFRDPPDEAAVRKLIGLGGGRAAADALTFDTIAAKDWVAASLAGLAPVSAGRYVVHGRHDRARVPPNAIGIEIEAALAFGTGHHGTTRGCLLALDALAKRSKRRRDPSCRHPEARAKRASKGGGRSSTDLGYTRDRITYTQVGQGRLAMACLRRAPQDGGSGSEKRVLDLGTGTGVLAIAAARTFRAHVLATDIDPVAVAAARTNAGLNRAAAFVETIRAAGTNAKLIRERAPYDLIFANILAGPLMRMAASVVPLAARGARVVLSGLLPAHANGVVSIYRAQGLVLERKLNLEGWVTLIMMRPAGVAASRRRF